MRGDGLVVLVPYVDVILLTRRDGKAVEDTTKMLTGHFKVTDLGSVNVVAGIQVATESRLGRVSLSQEYTLGRFDSGLRWKAATQLQRMRTGHHSRRWILTRKIAVRCTGTTRRCLVAVYIEAIARGLT